jgi:tetratricopeptide (TPR) repeat protein
MLNNENITLAEEYFTLGYSHHLNGEIEEAIEYYKKSIQLHPLAKTHTFLGWAYSLKGNYKEAIDECMTAIDLDPDFGNPYNDIGSYLIALHKEDEAVYWLEQALKATNYEPRHFPYYNLGIVCERKGEWFKALEFYHEALKLNPEYTNAKVGILRLTTLLN